MAKKNPMIQVSNTSQISTSSFPKSNSI